MLGPIQKIFFQQISFHFFVSLKTLDKTKVQRDFKETLVSDKERLITFSSLHRRQVEWLKRRSPVQKRVSLENDIGVRNPLSSCLKKKFPGLPIIKSETPGSSF